LLPPGGFFGGGRGGSIGGGGGGGIGGRSLGERCRREQQGEEKQRDGGTADHFG